MMKFIKDPLTWCIGVLVLFVIVIPGLGIYYSSRVQDSFEVSCQKVGGKVIVLRRDSLCTSLDGRIIGDL